MRPPPELSNLLSCPSCPQPHKCPLNRIRKEASTYPVARRGNNRTLRIDTGATQCLFMSLHIMLLRYDKHRLRLNLLFAPLVNPFLEVKPGYLKLARLPMGAYNTVLSAHLGYAVDCMRIVARDYLRDLLSIVH